MQISMAWTGLQAVGYGIVSGIGLLAAVIGAASPQQDGVPIFLMLIYLLGGAVWCMTRTYHTWMLRKAIIGGSLRPDFSGADAQEGKRWLRWEAITILFPTAGCPPISGVILLAVLGIRTNARQSPSSMYAGAGPGAGTTVFGDPFHVTTAWSQRRVPLP